MFLRPSSSLAPLSRAVNGILIRLQLGLVLQLNVSGNNIMLEGYLEQFARAELCLRLPILLRGCLSLRALFRAIWCQATD
jgi:hypothetical protein